MLLDGAIALFVSGLEVKSKPTAVSSRNKCFPGVHAALHRRKKAKSIDAEKSTGRLEAGPVDEDENLDATYQACTWLDDTYRTTLAST